MNKLNNFDNFIYDSLLEKMNINKYQYISQKMLKKIGVPLHYVNTYKMILSALIPIVVQIIEKVDINDATLLTILAMSILSNESKDKVAIIYTIIKENEIEDINVDNTINLLTNIKELFTSILKASDVEILTFVDMISQSGIIIPFIYVISSLIKNGDIDSTIFVLPFIEFRNNLDDDGLKTLIHKILHKLNITTNNTNKFQNKNNIKPLRVNDELKGPMAQHQNVIL